MKPFIKLIQLSIAITVLSWPGKYSLADDIDLYTSAIDTSQNNQDSKGHNILFVMDTSGSMKDVVAVLSPTGNYDNENIYAPSNAISPEKIYVYDDAYNFTNKTIELEQNKCNALTNQLSGDFPLYYDKGMQWVVSSTQVPGDDSCVRSDITTADSKTLGGESYNWKYIETLSFSADTPFTITITNDGLSEAWYEVNSNYLNNDSDDYFIYCSSFTADDDINFNFSDRADANYDTANHLAANQTIRCDGTVNNENAEIEIWSNGGAEISYSITGAHGAEVCTPSPGTTLTNSNWRKNLISTNDAANIFECKADAGNHGLSDISTLQHIRACGGSGGSAGCSSDQPNYVTTEHNPTWSGVDEKYYVSANYHDYLQTTGYVGEDLPEQNPDTYCNDRNKLGDRFEDSTASGARKPIYECYSRLSLMKQTVTNLAGTFANLPINVGLMRFNENNDEGGSIIDAVGAINNNGDFLTKLNGLVAKGNTPLSETLYEAYRYYKGGSVDQGRICNGSECTDPSAMTNGNYISPITASCQTNNIVFLTDGAATFDGSRDDEIIQLSSKADCLTTVLDDQGNPQQITVGRGGKCMDEIASVMATQDMAASIPDTNTVSTYTIGLGINLEILNETAAAGNGEYFSASSASGLEDAFRSIIVTILNKASSFAAPAVSVNAFNELQHRNEVYYSLFEPNTTPRWNGNVKKYKFNNNGDLVGQSLAGSVDTVIGEEGFFSDGAYSFWSDVVDGKDVTKGGAAAELSNTRDIFIGYDGNGLPTQLTTANIDTVPLSLLQTNSTGRTNNLKWLLGIDIWDDQESGSIVDANKFIADGIHTKPTVITYGGTEADPADVLFFATNLGTLHAVDPDDDKGTELWAHMAESHLPNLQAYTQSNFSPQHVYGLDGQMTSIVKPSTGTDATILVDSVYLYLGERRGGSNYYGFDVSNARIDADEKDIKIDATHTKPFKKLFTINGALKSKPAIVANPSLATPKFQDLAQTWSAMVPAKIKYNGVLKDVLIFTGGYDPRHDTSNYKSSDAVDGGANAVSDYGNAIYIVDAQTGGLLISIGNNNDDDDSDTTNANLRDLRQHDLPLPMQDSIVASPTVVDIDNDGAADLIFAVDIMGHVWRIDIDNTAIPADMVDGDMIADLSSSTANRRFYNALDVSRSNISSSGSDHLNIVVGSGYRASPNTDETFNSTAFSNNIYVLFDTPQVNIDTYQKVMAADLVETSSASPQSITTAPKGFFKQLDRKEKTLQRSLTFNNTIVVTTFLPGVNEGNACGGGLGSNRVYALDANTGVSVLTRRDANNNPIIHDGSENAFGDLVDSSDNIVYVNANNEIIEEWFGLKSAGIAAETTLLMLRELVVCFSAECNIDVIEQALLGDLELRKAYRSSWQEK